MRQRRIVMIYVEPTPYIRGFIEACRKLWGGEIKVYYITTDFSQSWLLDLGPYESVLPRARLLAARTIWCALAPSLTAPILHLAGWGHPLLFSSIVLAWLRDVPIVVESDSWRGNKDVGLREQVKSIVYSRLFQLPSHFLPGGSRQARYLNTFRVPECRITVAQMTVDVAHLMRYADQVGQHKRGSLRAELGLFRDDIVYLYVGRLEPHKGVSDLLAAFEALSRTHSKARLLVVGDGTLLSRVREAADRNAAITCTGRLTGELLWDAYVTSDVFVLPSLFEPWGLVVNEAQAFGLPVIVSNTAGCVDDLVPNGEEGITFPAGDTEALTRALVEFAESPDRRRFSSNAALKRISKWTLQAEALRVVDVWLKVSPGG